jgi:hypothetical protein
VSDFLQPAGRNSGHCQQNCQQICERGKTPSLLWHYSLNTRYRKSLVSLATRGLPVEPAEPKPEPEESMQLKKADGTDEE